MFEFKVKKTKEVDYASLVLWSLVAILSVMILVRFPKIVIPTGASKADSSVVFVVENLDLSAAQEKVLRAAPGVAESLGYNACYRLDKDQPKAKPFVEAAAKKGISPPLLAVSSDSKILSIQPFPTLNSLEGALD